MKEKKLIFLKTCTYNYFTCSTIIKFNLDIIPVFIERKKINKFKIEFQKRINPKNFKNKLELTEELNKVLEKMIIKNPNQWIWTHNRWK